MILASLFLLLTVQSKAKLLENTGKMKVLTLSFS